MFDPELLNEVTSDSPTQNEVTFDPDNETKVF